MSLDLTKVKDMRSATVYWNRTNAAGVYSWQTPINIPFIPDVACVRAVSSITTDNTHIMIVNSNLDSYGNRLLQFRGTSNSIYEHYFIPDTGAVRGGVATFEVLWGSLTNNDTTLIVPDSNVALSIAFQIEFYKF